MTAKPTDEKLIGFLTVIEPREGVLIGGYLILNSKARPIEFHCTAPVQPNRAQQILYGASLRPYLCGERIGQALVDQSKRDPTILCTDVADAIDLRERVSAPMIFVSADEPAATNGRTFVPLEIGTRTVWLHPADERLRATVEAQWKHFDNVCLNEPFGRIREAVREAQRDAAA